MASENTLPHLGGSEGNEAMLTVSHGLSCRISANMYTVNIRSVIVVRLWMIDSLRLPAKMQKMIVFRFPRNFALPFFHSSLLVRHSVEPGQTIWNKCVFWCDWNCSPTMISVARQTHRLSIKDVCMCKERYHPLPNPTLPHPIPPQILVTGERQRSRVYIYIYIYNIYIYIYASSLLYHRVCSVCLLFCCFMLGPLQSFTKAQIEGPPVLRSGLSTSWTAPDTSGLSWSTRHPAKANAKYVFLSTEMYERDCAASNSTVTQHKSTWPVHACCQLHFYDCSLQLHATTRESSLAHSGRLSWKYLKVDICQTVSPLNRRGTGHCLAFHERNMQLAHTKSEGLRLKLRRNSLCLCANCAHDAIHSHIATLHILPAWLAETTLRFLQQMTWCLCYRKQTGIVRWRAIISISVSLDGLKSSTDNNDARVRASANSERTCLSRPCAQSPKYNYHIWPNCVGISAFHNTTPGEILLLGPRSPPYPWLLHRPSGFCPKPIFSTCQDSGINPVALNEEWHTK